MKINLNPEFEVYYFFYFELTEKELLIENIKKIFFNINYTTPLKNLELVCTQHFILELKLYFEPLNVLSIKSITKFLGYSDIQTKNLRSQDVNYKIKLYNDCKTIILNLKELKLDIKNIYSPTSVALVLYHRDVKNEMYTIKLDLPAYSVEQFIYKYYIILKKYYNIKHTSYQFIKYSNIIKYKIEIPHIFIIHYLEELSKFNKNTLQKKLKKISQSENFFLNCLHYLENTKSVYNYSREDAFTHKFLFGGRLEVLSNIESISNKYSVITFDMPSAYFKILKNNKFPQAIPTISVTDNWDNNFLGFIDCTVEYIGPKLPVLPLRWGGKVVYPGGVFRGTWYIKELKKFLSIGGKLKKIHKKYFWEFEEPLFEQFCTNVENIKFSSDVEWYLKRIKTSFFGTFCQQPKSSNYVTIDNNLIQTEQEKLNVSTPSNYTVASIVTSLCRLELYNLYEIFEKKNIQVLYMSTDSITVYMEKEKIHTLIFEFPEYKTTFEKTTEYEDVLCINNIVKYFKKFGENNYLNYTGHVISLKEMDEWKKNFFSDKEAHSINGYRINFSNYTHRHWTNKRYNTTSIKISLK